MFCTLEGATLPHHTEYKAMFYPLENYKYLVETIQSDLKWHKHIQSITCKANQTLGLLKRNLKVLQQLTHFYDLQ